MSQILFGTQSRVFQIVTAAPTNVLSSNPNCESNEDRHIKCNPRQSGGKGKRVHWSPYRGSPRKRKSWLNCTAKTTIVNQQSMLFRHYRPFGCFSSRLNPISQIFFHDRLHDLGLLGQSTDGEGFELPSNSTGKTKNCTGCGAKRIGR